MQRGVDPQCDPSATIRENVNGNSAAVAVCVHDCRREFAAACGDDWNGKEKNIPLSKIWKNAGSWGATMNLSGARMNAAYDAGRIALMLNELRLPTIGRLWPDFAERSDKESWQASRLLRALLMLSPVE